MNQIVDIIIETLLILRAKLFQLNKLLFNKSLLEEDIIIMSVFIAVINSIVLGSQNINDVFILRCSSFFFFGKTLVNLISNVHKAECSMIFISTANGLKTIILFNSAGNISEQISE